MINITKLQIVSFIPDMLQHVRKSGATAAQQLADLTHVLLYLYPGFPDLYQPVVEALKVCF